VSGQRRTQVVTATSAIWITGVGTCTPLGSSLQEFARNLLAGQSAIRRVDRFDVSEHPSQIAGQLHPVPCPAEDDPSQFAQRHRLEQLARWCCLSALRDAGLEGERDKRRIGLVLGAGAEWLLRWESDGLVNWSADWQPATPPHSLAEIQRRELGLSGPALTVSAACASGNIALAQARAWLQMGWVDYCLAGACDMTVAPCPFAAFGNLRALSRRNDSPQTASRPFDRGRDGFVMGEGGAVFVLERAEQARRRGAVPLAELAGCGAASDAYHPVIPNPDPLPAATAMRRALADARICPEEVGYINAHATGTPVGDVCETRVLQTVFGETLLRIPVSSTKSMTGHLVTAAAAVEALACIIALREQTLPPTINLDDPDPECNLCHIPHQARPQRFRIAVSNSFGFGGSNTCVVLRAA